MPHKDRIKQKSIQERLRPLFTFKSSVIVLLVAIISIQAWTPEPSAEQTNKRREIINNQLSKELNECIAGNIDVIVGLHNCRPYKNHKQAVISLINQ